jgi:hypothetical protein
VTEFSAAELAAVFGEELLVEVEPLDEGSPAATVGLWRVRAGSDSAVLKLMRHSSNGHPRWPSAEEPEHPYYWRREALAYTSGLLARFSGSLRVPECRGCFERPDGAVALWLEDVQPPGGPWTPELLGEVAARLGAVHAAVAADPPTEEWLSRGWLEAYLMLRGPLPEGAEAVLARLDAAPQTLCHNDLHPANLLGPDATVLIDWAYCGLGALGLDAGVLVADALSDGCVEADRAEQLAQAVWDGYRAGLEGAHEVEARYAFLAGTALRYSWFARGLGDPELDPELRGRWTPVLAMLERWADEAARLPSAA